MAICEKVTTTCSINQEHSEGGNKKAGWWLIETQEKWTESERKDFLFLINLAAPGLSCGTWDLVPWQVIEPGLLELGARSLSHGLPGKSQNQLFFTSAPDDCFFNHPVLSYIICKLPPKMRSGQKTTESHYLVFLVRKRGTMDGGSSGVVSIITWPSGKNLTYLRDKADTEHRTRTWNVSLFPGPQTYSCTAVKPKGRHHGPKDWQTSLTRMWLERPEAEKQSLLLLSLEGAMELLVSLTE